MSFEADIQRLSQAALDFAERVLQAVVTEVGQPASTSDWTSCSSCAHNTHSSSTPTFWSFKRHDWKSEWEQTSNTKL